MYRTGIILNTHHIWTYIRICERVLWWINAPTYLFFSCCGTVVTVTRILDPIQNPEAENTDPKGAQHHSLLYWVDNWVSWVRHILSHLSTSTRGIPPYSKVSSNTTHQPARNSDSVTFCFEDTEQEWWGSITKADIASGHVLPCRKPDLKWKKYPSILFISKFIYGKTHSSCFYGHTQLVV